MKAFDVPRIVRAPLPVLTALATFTRYRAAILPVVDAELAPLAEPAAAIPDPGLRRAALQALTEKRANVEATVQAFLLAARLGVADRIRDGLAA